MHVLILSDRFDEEIVDRWIGSKARVDGVVLSCASPVAATVLSLFNYHVTIVHLSSTRFPHLIPFDHLRQDSQVALEQGRTIICIAGKPLIPAQDNPIYGWLSVNVHAEAAIGTNIQLTQHGKAQIFQDYFKNVNEYYVHWRSPISAKTIAVIADTELVIAAEYSIGKGKVVVLPPPSHDQTVIYQVIPSLYNMARKYYEDMQKRIFVGDEPPWVQKHKSICRS